MALDGRSERMRMSVLGAVAISLFAALFARVWYLQVINEQELAQQAVQNVTREIIEPAPRGRILDVKGRVLVDNRPSIVVTLDKETVQREVPADEVDQLFLDLATELSAAGRLTKVSEIRRAFESDRYGPFAEVPVVRDISEELQVYLAERSHLFPGVGTDVVTVRDYPYGELAAHVLGYVGVLNEEEFAATRDKPKQYQRNDEIGKSGIELFYEDQLRGTPGRQVVEVDRFNNIVEVLEDVPPVAGSDVQLTIDIDIQAMAEAELKAGLDAARAQATELLVEPEGVFEIEYRAPAGGVVLLDPDDGSVRAMASYPTYDPSLFVNGISAPAFEELNDPDNDQPLLNRVIQGNYAPGSTFKVITAYAALDTGLIGSRGVLGVRSPYDDIGYFTVPGCEGATCEIQNAGRVALGPVDLPRSLAVSSDVYYYNLAYNFDVRRGFDRDSIQQTAIEWGFGRQSGITLPNESAGRMPTPEDRRLAHEANPEAFPDPEWRTGDTINTSIGQGDVLATPLQIANAYAIIANGGTHYAPNVAWRVLDAVTGDVEQEFGPRVLDEIYWPESFSGPILEGLRGALVASEANDGTDDEGTAFRAFEDIGFPIDRWPVAGKTGTSEKKSADKVFADFALFAAFGPVTAPEIVGTVVLEEAGFGGKMAAPVLARIFKAIAEDSVPVALTLRQQAGLDPLPGEGTDGAGGDGAPDDGSASDEAAGDGTDTPTSGDEEAGT